MILQRCITVLICVFLLQAAHCSTAVDEPSRTDRVPASVVVMAPAAAEMLEALDLLDRVVGIAEFGPWPAEVAGLPSVGGYDSPNVEQVLELGCDLLLLDGTGAMETAWPELAGPPDLSILRDAIRILRDMKKEGDIDLLYFGGARSGTDAAKLIAQGVSAVVLGVPVALAMGGRIMADRSLAFASDYSDEDRRLAVANILKASVGEASMMARCTGKTNIHNLEPEDLKTITLAASEATGIPLAGTR